MVERDVHVTITHRNSELHSAIEPRYQVGQKVAVDSVEFEVLSPVNALSRQLPQE